MKYRPTGIGAFGGSLSWETHVTSKDRFEHLFLFLESKRILTNPAEMEVAAWCIRSVLEIKEMLVTITKDIEFRTKDIDTIRSMIDACNEYLDLVGTNNNTGIIYKTSTGWADASFGSAMKGFRDSFRELIKEIEKDHKIKFNKTIPEEY